MRHRIAFLPDYDIGMARYLYGGCDVWLNNPLRPLEACGTSGMKSALNGGLNLSIRDGWWDEMFDGENGWAIPTADGVSDPDRRDALEAQALYELIETSVRTRFYDRNASGRAIAMDRHGAAHAGEHRPEGAGQQDGSRLRARALHPCGRRVTDAGRRLIRAGAGALAVAQPLSSTAGRECSVVHVETGGVGDAPLGRSDRSRCGPASSSAACSPAT